MATKDAGQCRHRFLAGFLPLEHAAWLVVVIETVWLFRQFQVYYCKYQPWDSSLIDTAALAMHIGIELLLVYGIARRSGGCVLAALIGQCLHTANIAIGLVVMVFIFSHLHSYSSPDTSGQWATGLWEDVWQTALIGAALGWKIWGLVVMKSYYASLRKRYAPV